jgi:hypothetical protein
MSLKITPDECRVLERGLDIMTRCPRESIDDAMIAARALAANLANGDAIKVRCTTHDRNTILHARDWLVFSRTTGMETDEANERSPRTFERITYQVMPLTDWLTTPAGKEAEPAKAEKPAKKAA